MSATVTARFDSNGFGTPRARIFLVEDHPLTRQGLAMVLDREADLCVCGEASDRSEALERMSLAKPDMTIVDLALKQSDGLELIKDIRAQFNRVKVLVVSMLDELLYGERALRAGALGFVSKVDAAASVVQAVRNLLRGEVYLSQRVALQVVARIAGNSRPCSILEKMTDRELQVFRMIGDGLGRRQIAQRLHLDVNTVETYRSRIKEKLNLKDALELRQCAINMHSNNAFQSGSGVGCHAGE